MTKKKVSTKVTLFEKITSYAIVAVIVFLALTGVTSILFHNNKCTRESSVDSNSRWIKSITDGYQDIVECDDCHCLLRSCDAISKPWRTTKHCPGCIKRGTKKFTIGEGENGQPKEIAISE